MGTIRQRYRTWAAMRLREERGASILEFIFAAVIVLVVFLVFLQIALIVNSWQMANYAAFMSARSMITNSTIWPIDWGGPHARTAKNIMAGAYKGSNYEAKAIYFTVLFTGGVLVYWEIDLILPPPLNRPFDLTDPDDFIPWAICSILPDWICSGSDIDGDNRAMVLGYAPLPFNGIFALPGTGQLGGAGMPRECEMWDTCPLMDLTDNK